MSFSILRSFDVCPRRDAGAVNTSWLVTTQPQFEAAQKRIEADINQWNIYLDEAFNNIIFDLTNEINSLQQKVLLGNNRVNEGI